MAKCTSVQHHMTFHGLFFSKSAKSCFGEDFSLLMGLMRSFVVENVIRNKTRHNTAQMVIVICQPYCLSAMPTVAPAACLAANLATNGSVNPPTMNCAAFTAMKRNEFSFARSLTSPVITPPSAA